MPIKIIKPIRRKALLILSIGLCLSVGILGSFFTVSSIPTWYATLIKPSFSPPNWIFGPVWTTLYILMGVSLFLVWEKRKVPVVFWIQLVLNSIWSIIFFGFKSPGLALVNILALWVAIILTMRAFYKVSPTATYILIPYILWVSFAVFLNLFIVILN